MFPFSIYSIAPSQTPPMSPGPMGGPGMRTGYHGGPPGPGMPGPPVQPAPKKLDPDQMPSVVSVLSLLLAQLCSGVERGMIVGGGWGGDRRG